MQIGTPPQVVRILPSTSGSEILAVLPEGCIPGLDQDLVNCADRRGLTYQPNNSSTFSRIGNGSEYVSLPVAESGVTGFDGSAEAGYDNLTFGWPDDGGISIKHHTVFSYAVKDPFLGQLGLSHWPINIGNFNDQYQSLLDSFRTQGTIISSSWSYTAGAHYRIDNAFASLTLGGRDTLKFDGGHVAEFQLGSDSSRDLLVTLSGIDVSDVKSSVSAPTFPITVLIDSTVTSIYLPDSVCSYFETVFGLTWDNATSLYLLNSTQHDALVARNASITFSLESTTTSVNITLPYAAFDLTASYPLLGTQANASLTSHYFPLQRGRNESEYTLGRTFLQEAYVTVDYDRGNFSVAPATFPTTILGPLDSSPLQVIYPPGYGGNITSARAKKHGLSPGGIAGVSLASVVLMLVILAFGAYLFKRRWSRAQRLRNEHEHEISKLKPELENKNITRNIKEYAELHGHQRVVEMSHNEKSLAEAAADTHFAELQGQQAVAEMDGERLPEIEYGHGNPVELPAEGDFHARSTPE